MNVLWGFTSTKKILHFEMNVQKATVFIRACPATIIGWLISLFVHSNETTIHVDENLFVSDEWGFFRRKIMYIPVKSITSISMRENFRTVLFFLSILSFFMSMFLIYYMGGSSFKIVQNLQMLFFSSGVIFMALAFLLKQRVFITIYRGNHTHELKFRATDQDLERIKKTLQMIMFLSTGQDMEEITETFGDKEINTLLEKDTLGTQDSNSKSKDQQVPKAGEASGKKGKGKKKK